ncbi:hypothetical protein AX17_002671 [Amanita inopinata Kibby_2008]|nr:hypothetical protein AX17_002671 [Amanita inopinata Kibby_2008]
MINYKDDDGEVSCISTDADLMEAIDFFNDGSDEGPTSSRSSVYSGRSHGSRKITMNVEVLVDFEGQLSDTASLDDFHELNESQESLTFPLVSNEPDDDSVTVSSRDYITTLRPSNGRGGLGRERADDFLSQRMSDSSWLSATRDDDPDPSHFDDLAHANTSGSAARVGADPFLQEDEDVIDSDHHHELAQDDWFSVDVERPAVSDRHAAWLREQNSPGIRPHANDSPIALEQSAGGKYYYAYKPTRTRDLYQSEEQQARPPSPSSRHREWLESARIGLDESDSESMSSVDYTNQTDSFLDHTLDYQPHLPQHSTSPPPDQVTDCSHCGVRLETIRYVCSSCGPKQPLESQTNGWTNSSTTLADTHTYPPTSRFHLFPSVGSSYTVMTNPDPFVNPARHGLLSPSLVGDDEGASKRTPLSGFELCSECVQSSGLYHAIESSRDQESSPISVLSVFSFLQSFSDLSGLHRSAPKKGKLRHAFREQVWENNRWTDVQQDETTIRTCSMCSNDTDKKRYKCIICKNINMCQSCYSQVHDLHPNHPFVTVPDVEVSKSFRVHPPQEEQPLRHPGVHCVHCQREIIGARYHCPYCGVDICQSCEAVGLPGNQDASDGGHDSTHIMLKIPYHLDREKVHRLSANARRARIGPPDATAIGSFCSTNLSPNPQFGMSINLNPNHPLEQPGDRRTAIGHNRRTISVCKLPLVNF